MKKKKGEKLSLQNFKIAKKKIYKKKNFSKTN